MNRLFSNSSPFRLSPTRLLVSYALLGVWALIVLFPLYWLVITAFKLPIDVSSPKYIPFVDYQPSLHAWNEMLAGQGTTVTRPYFNTIIVATASALAALVLGSFAAYALTRFEYRPKPGLILTFIGCVAIAIVLMLIGLPWQLAVPIGFAIYLAVAFTIGKRFRSSSMGNNDIAFWLISQRMLPPVAVIIPIYMLFQTLGMLNTRQALIITYCAANLPIVIWFMRDYFQTIPIELEESAFIDGANRYQLLLRIILPLAAPGLIATFLIVLVFAWNEYVIALFLTGADTQTMPLLVSAQNATRGPQWWNISVLVMLMVGPLIAMAVVLERYIAKGLLVGAVKG
jgi:multiple sugar transport system permease protein